MPAFCRNRHFVLSGYILCHSEMLYPLQLFHLQRSRVQIIALLRVVRDQQHGAAGGAAGKRVHALAGSGFIQPFEGLVQHQQRRIVQQRSGQGNAALHAAGQRAHCAAQRVRQIQLI